MRVALIYLGRRGAGGWISFELAQQLEEKSEAIIVISHDMEQLFSWKSLRAEKVFTRTFRNIIFAIISLIIPLQINALIRKIKQHKPDILLFTMFHPWNAYIQKKMQDVPSVAFVHDPRPHPDLMGWIYGKLEQASISKATRCIILSKNLVEDLVTRGISKNHIDIIPLGLFRRITPNSSLPSSKRSIPTLLFFGRIVPYKGIETLLQAYAELHKTRQIRLIIAGEGDLRPFHDFLYNLPDIEIMNYWIPEHEIGNIFSKSDLLILPYTSASQSGVIPIAASFSLPVIATRAGGIPEQIEDGISGWLIYPNNKNALITAIKDALDHPDIAQQRGMALNIRYQNEFNWEKIGQRVLESLNIAIQSKGKK